MKRLNGDGSIYQLPSGKWRGLVSIGGKRLSHTSKTRKEITAWIRQITGQVEQGLSYDSARVTVGDFLIRWLASKENSIRPTTYSHYKIIIEKHLAPALGIVLIKDLTPDRIQYIYDEWIRSGYGAPTVIKTHAVLHQALERAVRLGLLVRNITDLVSPPKGSQEEMRFWSEMEANRFLTATRENRLYALFHLAIATGARQMEILGLKWSDLDWLRGTLRISRQLSRKGEMFSPLKTNAGRRTLELGPNTLAALREHSSRQQLERRIAGDRWQENDLIFTSRIGSPMHHKNLTDRYFKPLVLVAGVPEIRFHDLRHTAVAIMLSNGVSIFVVSKIVGHARASITSDTYGHLVPGTTTAVGKLMDDLIAPVSITVKDLSK
jgi:integrase